MTLPIVDLFRHHVWANLVLLDFCAALPSEALDVAEPGTYGSIRETLVHLVGAEQRYLARFGETDAPVAVSEDHPFPGWDALRRSAAWSGERFAWLAGREPGGRILRGVRRGEPFAIPATVFLIQVIDHGKEHRTHVATVLGRQGIEAPDLDGWSFEEHLQNDQG